MYTGNFGTLDRAPCLFGYNSSFSFEIFQWDILRSPEMHPHFGVGSNIFKAHFFVGEIDKPPPLRAPYHQLWELLRLLKLPFLSSAQGSFWISLASQQLNIVDPDVYVIYSKDLGFRVCLRILKLQNTSKIWEIFWKIWKSILSKARCELGASQPLFTNPKRWTTRRRPFFSRDLKNGQQHREKLLKGLDPQSSPWPSMTTGWFGGTLMTWEPPIWYDPIYSQAQMDMFWKSVPPFYSTGKSWFPFNDHLLEVSQFETKPYSKQ